MRVLITGANGYLGGWVTHTLESQGHTVSGYTSHDQLFYKTKDKPQIRLHQADVIILLGWYSKVGNAHPELQQESLARTIEYVKHVNKKQYVIFASTVGVYGNPSDDNERLVNEEHSINPLDYYSKCKVAAESFIRANCDKACILRIGSLMGRGYEDSENNLRYRTKKELVVNAFAIEGYKNQCINVWHPNAYKPVIHVKDTADIIARLSGLYDLDIPIVDTINVCHKNYRAISIAETVASITKALVYTIPSPQNDNQRSVLLDNRKLLTLFPDLKGSGWSRGLKETIKEFKDYEEGITDRNTPWNQERTQSSLSIKQCTDS